MLAMEFFDQLPILLGKVAILIGLFFATECFSPVVFLPHGVLFSDSSAQRVVWRGGRRTSGNPSAPRPVVPWLCYSALPSLRVLETGSWTPADHARDIRERHGSG